MTDSNGASGTDNITVTIAVSANTPPEVSISAPPDGATFAEGEQIAFSGIASDREDGDITTNLTWLSDLDGPIGDGGSFANTLSAGTHTITATATDSADANGMATITVTVNPLSIGDIDAPDSVDFGDVQEQITVEREIAVTNTGTGTIIVSDAPTENAEFAVSVTPGDAFPLVLGPGTSRNLIVSFTPPAGSGGTTLTGVLRIESNDVDEPTLEIMLTGNAIDPSDPPLNNPVLGARIVDGTVFDLISTATCANVGGEVAFDESARAATDSYRVTLTDQGGQSVTSSVFQAPEGPMAFT